MIESSRFNIVGLPISVSGENIKSCMVVLLTTKSKSLNCLSDSSTISLEIDSPIDSIDESENHNEIIKRLFTEKSVKKEIKISYKTSEIRPIFILGMPRSGTSLIEQIISSHASVYGAGELRNLTKILIPIIKEFVDKDKYNISENEFVKVREQYFKSLTEINASEKIITDKWPLNFRHIGFILSALPEAKIVHVKRDARAVCWSIYKHYFSGEGNGWAYNLDDLSKFYKLYVPVSYTHLTLPTKRIV